MTRLRPKEGTVSKMYFRINEAHQQYRYEEREAELEGVLARNNLLHVTVEFHQSSLVQENQGHGRELWFHGPKVNRLSRRCRRNDFTSRSLRET